MKREVFSDTLLLLLVGIHLKKSLLGSSMCRCTWSKSNRGATLQDSVLVILMSTSLVFMAELAYLWYGAVLMCVTQSAGPSM